MKKIFIFTLIITTLLSACSIEPANPFYIHAGDDTRISANYFPADSDKGILLIHSLGSSKASWKQLVPELTSRNYNVLSIDMRGHGFSDYDWRSFDSDDFNKAVLDVEAGISFLEDNGVDDIAVIGSSIGANIALKHASQNPEIKSLILLSPSLNYRGVKTASNMEKYSNPVLIIVGKEDIQSYEGSKKLHNISSGKKDLIITNSSTHGTLLLQNEEVKLSILRWLGNTI